MNASERGWPEPTVDSETGEQRWRNYHPREMWTMPPGFDPETSSKLHPQQSLLYSPEFGCHEETYTGNVIDPRYQDTLLRVNEFML